MYKCLMFIHSWILLWIPFKDEREVESATSSKLPGIYFQGILEQEPSMCNREENKQGIFEQEPSIYIYISEAKTTMEY